MELYLVRHAAAVERSPEIPETHRYLTPEGRKAFRKGAGLARKKGMAPDLILTSPLIRAVQSADILAETLSYVGPLQVVEELATGFSFLRLKHLLKRMPMAGALVLVGHEPDLSLLTAELLAIPDSFGLKKGAIVALTLLGREISRPASFNWIISGGKVVNSPGKFFPGGGR